MLTQSDQRTGHIDGRVPSANDGDPLPDLNLLAKINGLEEFKSTGNLSAPFAMNMKLLTLVSPCGDEDCLIASSDKLALCDFLCRCGLIQKNDDLSRYMRFLGAGTFLSMLRYNYAVVCRRPAHIKTVNNRLHCDDGPAIKWADGTKWYYLNNIRVPEEVITKPPDDFDPGIMLQTKNAEVRQEIVSKIGIDRLITKLNGQLLNRWNGYELIKLPIPDMQIVPVYLKMTNPSTGTIHIEGVPPYITTCREALAWRAGGKKWSPKQLT